MGTDWKMTYVVSFGYLLLSPPHSLCLSLKCKGGAATTLTLNMLVTSSSYVVRCEMSQVESAVLASVEKDGLIPHPSWCLKVIQLYETTLVRHGVMTVGPPGSGKSSIIHTLQACTNMKRSITTPMNKQHSCRAEFGHFTPAGSHIAGIVQRFQIRVPVFMVHLSARILEQLMYAPSSNPG